MRRRILVGSTGALAILTATVSLAWACVPGATLSLSPASGPAGTPVQATMSAVPDETIELRWGAPTGQPLASGRGPTFSFTVPPGTAPGDYSVFVWHAEHGHAVGSALFQVRAAPAPPPNPIVAPVGAIMPTPTQTAAARKRAALARAVKRCKRKYKAKRSHSAQKKRKLRKSRSACIRRAKKRYR